MQSVSSWLSSLLAVLLWGAILPQSAVADETVSLGNASLHFGTNLTLSVHGAPTEGVVFSGTLGTTLPTTGYTLNVTGQDLHKTIMLIWPNMATLQLRNALDLDPSGGCTEVTWQGEGTLAELTDCFLIAGSSWYGGAETHQQSWPLGKFPMQFSAFVANENTYPALYGAVTERLWWSSLGAGVQVPDDVPLHVSINASGDDNLCLQGKVMSPYRYPMTRQPWLKYVICRKPDIREIHRFLYSTFIVNTPTDTPNSDVIRYPIWSTWAYFKQNITQAKVLQYAQDIKAHGFRLAQLEIDDDWTPHYGDLVFDAAKFPQPRAMVDQLHHMGINVTVWVHPFKNVDSQAFQLGAARGWLLKNESGHGPALAKWWAGIGWAGVVDFTNPRAAQWYLAELHNIHTLYGVDSFKYDAGEVLFLPPSFTPFTDFMNPDTFTTLYARVATSADVTNRRQEVRTGRHNQRLPVMVRMDDRYSSWDYDQGLKTLVPTALHFGVLGYPFVLPDLVGGNEYNGRRVDRELFIRWTQANALLPTIQFSIPPWAFDQEVESVCRDLMKLREQYGDLLLQLAQEAVKTGTPMARPTWWLAPGEQGALEADQQFLLGDSLLVAPVVDQGAKTTRIYLPSGRWRDELRGGELAGPQWLDYAVSLHDLPRFSRLA